jgi:alpha-L-rhamnosidase
LARARLGDYSGMAFDIKAYWGGMLDASASTFWEAYEPMELDAQHLAFYGRPFGRSACHAWASGPAYLLSQELCGLHSLAPDGRKFGLASQTNFPGALHLAMPTRQGLLVVDRTEDCLQISVPADTEFHQLTSSGKHVRHAGPCNIRIKPSATRR